jgi:alkanesulfonate monooxygenase SsuD/methylene tetrahydromethanopterin reductase-like flavin-dependent oxidoreductase (luciferase family)
VKLGTIALWGNDLEAFRGEVRLAEELGYDLIGVGDSSAAWQDMFVSMTLAALETKQARLSPMVTTPHLRHPAVTARAMSSIAELSGGRALMTIGSGGSAMRSVGRGSGATQDEMRAFVTAVRASLSGGAAPFEGRTSLPLAGVHDMPVWVSADGPKGLALAGELGDGVVLSVGLDLDLVRSKIKIVYEAAEKAGRDPNSIELTGLSFPSVRATRDEAKRDVTAFLASTAGMGLKAPHMRARIPADVLPKVEEMERRYDATQHVVPGGVNALLLEELGLADFMLGLNAIVGSPEEVAAHLTALEGVGMSRVLVPLPGNTDPEGTLRRMATAAGIAG